MQSLIPIAIGALFFLGSIFKAQAQRPVVFDQRDSLLRRMEQIPLSDSAQLIQTALMLMEGGIDRNGQDGEAISRRILAIAKDRGSEVLRIAALSTMGQYYRLAGNPVRAIRTHQEAVAAAMRMGNWSLIAYTKNQMAHIYKDRLQNEKAIELYYQARDASLKGNVRFIQLWPLANIGYIQYNMGRYDSALYYCQAAERELFASGRRGGDNSIISMLFGATYAKRNRPDLAQTYFKAALATGIQNKSKRYTSDACNRLAGLYFAIGNRDSALHYGLLAVQTLHADPMFNLSMAPAKLIATMYKGVNCDSSFKYAQIAEAAGDSLNSLRVNQQIEALTFEDELKQMDEAKAREVAEQTRIRNIRYAFMALGIVVVIMLYFILSRSFIANIRVIEYGGVLALLIVFEFMNLVLHPILEGVTHHEPVLMLLCLVALAALLVPFHHKIEHWAISALVKKNKQVRLANARRTLEELS